MQVTAPPPLPVSVTALPQETVVKAVQQVLPQVTAPQTQRAVEASRKSVGDNKSRSNGDRAKGGDKTGRGEAVNLKV